MQKIHLGFLGFGQVASGTYKILNHQKATFKKDAGVQFVVEKIAVRSLRKKRLVKAPAKVFTTNPKDIINDPKIDIVVELMGGTTKAFDLVMASLKAGKHVVTANKALLAERGDEIFTLATKMKKWVFFEASVGGGIPILKSIRESLIGNDITAMHAIINGTSNYILSKMSTEGYNFRNALKRAQEKGYAEADPTLDLNGMDAAHKLAILVRFGFGGKVKLKDIYCEGIEHIRSEDISFAEEFGYRVKLVAIAKKSGDSVEARVQPTLLPKHHMLANVHGSFNAIYLHGNHVGDVLLYGPGAGSLPTASAVVSDLVDIAKRYNRLEADAALPMRAHSKTFKVKHMPSIESRYYLRFIIKDEAGTLARITKVLGDHDISISDCVQKERNVGNAVSLIVLTHDAHEKDVRAAIKIIDRLKQLRGSSQVIRIENSN